MDFSTISHEDTIKQENVGGGGFKETPPQPGPALLRLREYIELGMVQEEFDGKPKKNLSHKCKVVFEIVHAVDGSHAINKEDGTFVRNKEITLYLNRSFNDRAKFRKLFNKLNYAGAVPVVKGECPSLHHFLGQGFLATISLNVSEKTGKTYVNIDKDGEFTVGRPAVPVTDAMGVPTGEVNEIDVPMMQGEQACFLWGSDVSDEMLQAMWDSIDRGTYEKDGETLSRSFERMDIMNPELNVQWLGSREQLLLAPDALDADLEADNVVPMDAPAATADPAPAAEPTAAPATDGADPLAALGV